VLNAAVGGDGQRVIARALAGVEVLLGVVAKLASVVELRGDPAPADLSRLPARAPICLQLFAGGFAERGFGRGIQLFDYAGAELVIVPTLSVCDSVTSTLIDDLSCYIAARDKLVEQRLVFGPADYTVVAVTHRRFLGCDA
jgi:hypothetical protein